MYYLKVIGLCLCGFIFTLVVAERCKDVHNCILENCPPATSHLACHASYCTCDPDPGKINCTFTLDCDGKGICLQPNTTQKCYSGYCQCLFNSDLPQGSDNIVG